MLLAGDLTNDTVDFDFDINKFINFLENVNLHFKEIFELEHLDNILNSF